MPQTFAQALAATFLLGSVHSAAAEALRPHEAVYDLQMTSDAEEIERIEARIALDLETPSCADYKLDYRFVARFHRADDVTVTDQQTVATEAQDGTRFEFRTRNLADGSEQSVVEGTAENQADGTRVAFRAPVNRVAELPRALFPMHHTADLVRRAQAGERIVETRIFDGDEEADGSLTTTSVILPASAQAKPLSEPAQAALDGMASWWIDESYYDSTSDGDGAAIFRTRYRLFANGVSDDITMDFGDYAIGGRLSSLALHEARACP